MSQVAVDESAGAGDNDTNYDLETYATSEVPDYLRQYRQALPSRAGLHAGEGESGNMSPSRMAENAMTETQNSLRCFERSNSDSSFRK